MITWGVSGSLICCSFGQDGRNVVEICDVKKWRKYRKIIRNSCLTWVHTDRFNAFCVCYLHMQMQTLCRAVAISITTSYSTSVKIFYRGLTKNDEKSKTTARLTQRDIFKTIFRMPKNCPHERDICSNFSLFDT